MTALLSILTAVVNSLWQALAVTVLVWLVLRFAHRINAATRYAIWWATLGVVLILPVAPRLISAIRTHPHPVALATAKPSSVTLAPVIVEPVVVTIPPDRMAIWPLAVAAIWAAILLWRLYQIGRSYFYLRRVKQRSVVSAVPLPVISRRADLLISRDITSPMAVGFVRPAIILPESLVPELSEPERDHVLLHESAHLAKYDDWTNLAMRILGGVLALHPIAVWILRRIEREREMACDDWVVARTGSAKPYAASLARLVELRQAARREMLASGLFGNTSRIGDRIEMLLRRGREFSPRISNGGVITGALTLAAIMFASSLAPRWIAFIQQSGPSFEVIAIHPNRSGAEGSIVNLPDTGKLSVTNATLKTLVCNAYPVQKAQVIGGPAWLDKDRFDIQAETARRIAEREEQPLMRSLLAQRFHLRVHRGTREMPVYALTIAKTGRKFIENTGTNSTIHTAFGPEGAHIDVTRVSLEQLAGMLGKPLGRVVLNRTGLNGYYDFHLEWDPEPTADSSKPSLFAALQEQLGLKLEATKGPVDILVVDHAEKPDAN